MKKLITMFVVLFSFLSLSSQTIIKGDLVEVKKEWQGIWRVDVYSFDGGKTPIMGENKVFGIMTGTQLEQPNGGRTDVIDKIRIISIDGEEYTIISFKNITDLVWMIKDYGDGSLRLTVKKLATGEETARFLINITGYIKLETKAAE